MSTEEEVERVHSELVDRFMEVANAALQQRHPELVASAIIVAASHVAMHGRSLVRAHDGRPAIPSSDDINDVTKQFKKRAKEYVQKAYPGRKG